MIPFLDATSLLATYVQCSATDEIRGLLKKEKKEGVAVAAHIDLEIVERLMRLHSGGMSTEETEAILAVHQRISADFLHIPTDPLFPEAAVLMARHGLEASAAINLAAALDLSRRILRQAPQLPGSPVIVVTLNRRLHAAAQSEGLPVFSSSHP